MIIPLRPFVLLAFLLAALVARGSINTALQMQLGNPSGATADPANQTRYLIQRAQYALDYNATTREPNWVAWNLTVGDLGSSGRSDFVVDTTLPAGFYQVLTTDYSGSGYDRGHMCPSGDRTITTTDNQFTFFMSNMLPQAPDNNQGVWASFETYCRTLANAGNELLIISGPSGFAGSTIASGVAIPGYTWKVAVVVPNGAGTAASRITTSTRVIAIKIPNIAGIRNNPWQNYVTSAAQIESDTGYTFFTDLSAPIRAALRVVVDGQTATGSPAITTQPSGQSAPVGGTATFSVAATGDAPLAYQWTKNDVEIAGATGTSLTLSGVAAGDAATYTVVVTNNLGSVTSAGAVLVVTGIAPSIVTSPSARSVAAGSTTTFAVTASGSPTLTYQWRKAGVNLANGANVSGATTAVLALSNVQSSDAANYDVVVSNGVNPSATSSAAALTVTPSAPTITLQPAAAAVTTGSTANFTVTALGTSPLNYQWRKAGVNLSDGGNIAGATTATLTISNAQSGDAANYDVVVSNSVNPSATSSAVALTVSAAGASSTIVWDFAAATPTSGLPSDVTGGTVTQNNNNGTTTMISTTSPSSGYTGSSGTSNAGAAARTGALATGTSGSAYFEWTLTPAAGKQLNTTALSFGSRSTGTGPVSYSLFTSIDNYATAVATGTLTNTNTSTWGLNTLTLPTLTGTTGTAVTFRLYGHSGTGSPGLGTANWRIDDLKHTVNTIVAPPTAPALLSSTPANAATGVAINSAIALTFNQAITVAGSWFTLNSSTTGALAATVTGGPTTFTLTPPNSFANSDTITLTLVASQITDQATGALHPAANQIVSFTTITPVAPSISTQPIAQTTAAGGTATFTVVASGTAPLSYQWRKAGVAISGNGSATSPTLTLTNVQAGDAANYDVVVSNGVSPAATSNAVALTVTPAAPTITTQPIAQTALAGGNVSFTVAATGTSPFTYQWRKGGVALANGGIVSGATSATLTLTGVALSDAGTFDVVVSNGVNPAATSTGVALTVNPAPTSIIYWDFASASPTSGLPPELTGAVVTQGNNNGTTTLLTTTSASSGYTGVSGSNNAGAAARTGALVQGAGGSAYFEFTLTPLAGQQVRVLSLSFGARSTGTGPQAYAVYSSLDSFAAPIASGTLANNSNWALLAPTLTPQLPAIGAAITLRIFGYNGIGSASPSTANWRIDDLKVGVTVPPTAPVIATQPQGVAALALQTVSFSVTAAPSSATPTYQWRKGGNAIAGATAATFTLSSVTLDSAGSYDVVLTNSVGSTTSTAAVLTVTRRPVSFSFGNLAQVYDGTPHTVTVTSTPAVAGVVVTYSSGTPPINAGTYGVSASVDDPNYSGIDTAVLTIAKATQSIAFGALPATPVVGVPFGVTATASSGLPVAFSIVSGNAALNGASLTLTDAAPVVLRATQPGNANLSAASTEVTLSGLVPPRSDQTIAFAPLADRPSTAAPQLLTATASSGLPVSFTLVSGPATLTGNLLTLTRTAGVVTVRATQPGNAAFNAAPPVERSFAVTLANSAPVIVAQPTAQAALVGGGATFSVTAIAVPAPTYQWRKDGAAISGAIGPALTLSGLQAADAGAYDVVVSNPLGSVTSSLARLTVGAASAPVFTRQPTSIAAVVGRSVQFSAAASGAPAPTYQWFKDGSPLPGATGPVLGLDAVTPAQTGGYSVVAANSAGSATSATATLRVFLRSFAGTYFGPLAGGGTFAILINDDHTGVFLAFLPGSRTAYLSRAVTVEDTGRFRFGASTTGGATPLQTPGTPPIAAAIDDLVVEGAISENGALSGSSTTGAPLTLTGSRSADLGATAGFFQAGAANGSAQAFAIIGTNGNVLFVTQSGAAIDGGAGTVNSFGNTFVTTAGGQTITAVVSAESASLSATVTGTNGVGITFSGASATSEQFAAQRLANLSARATAGNGEQAAIAGFVVSGVESKTVLVRAVGPALRGFGVATAVASPRLELLRAGTAAPLATNTGWGTAGNSAELANAALRSGAFPFAAGSADSAIIATLAPGSYTAVATPVDGRPGTGLVEIYDLSSGSAAQRLVNLSTRATAGTGDATLIAGLVVSGGAPKRVLVRAAGPALTAFGVAGALARPQLALLSGSATIATNAGWSASPDAAAIAEAAARVGAFAFTPASNDAALILNLAPGAYTAQVTGVGGSTGIALIEIYELP